MLIGFPRLACASSNEGMAFHEAMASDCERYGLASAGPEGLQKGNLCNTYPKHIVDGIYSPQWTNNGCTCFCSCPHYLFFYFQKGQVFCTSKRKEYVFEELIRKHISHLPGPGPNMGPSDFESDSKEEKTYLSRTRVSFFGNVFFRRQPLESHFFGFDLVCQFWDEQGLHGTFQQDSI